MFRTFDFCALLVHNPQNCRFYAHGQPVPYCLPFLLYKLYVFKLHGMFHGTIGKLVKLDIFVRATITPKPLPEGTYNTSSVAR